MRRRIFLAAAAPLLATPAVAQPARILRFVPNVDVPVLDGVVRVARQLG
jgi:hypothetical protein